MKIKKAQRPDKEICGWEFTTNKKVVRINNPSLDKACLLFQERFGYFPDPRQAVALFERCDSKNVV